MIFAYRYGSLIALVLGVAWAVIFAIIGWWILVAVQVGIAATALTTHILVRQGRFAFGIIVVQACMLVVLVAMGLIVDVPDANHPRVSHLYLLAIAAMGYLNFQRDRTTVQLCLVVLCLAAYVVLASVPLSLPFQVMMPEAMRATGTWVNTIVATLMLAGSVYAIGAEQLRRNTFSRNLMKALWHGEFSLAYQPQVDREGVVVGAEALLRWTSPQHGQVSPADFIPQAEQAGLMVPIGSWVLEEACQTLAAWSRQPAHEHLTLSVNVSADQLLDESFTLAVSNALTRSGAPPERLVLELTESVLVSEMDLAIAKLERLRGMGITISLDDFGTGYSSLSYLHLLPIQQIKIDRGFVQDAVKGARNASLAENVIRIGHDLGLDVLAEGVETVEQHNLMAKAGCRHFQGFLYGRPMRRQEFEQHLATPVRTLGQMTDLRSSEQSPAP